MAAINLQILSPADKTFIAPRVIGNGVPVVTDALYTNTNTYPVGTEYFDLTGLVTYRRVATAGVLADYVASAASTAL